jgi:RNA polymerase sigma-70 factor (ECF subfamily)
VRPDTTTLFVEHRRSLIDYATRIVGSRAHAEDVVQEAWMRFDEVSRHRLLDEPLGYLYRIVRNLALDGRRSQAREERYLVRGADLQAEGVAEDLPSPEAQAADRGDLRAVQAALLELPERTRIALEMHRFGGATLSDIADFLDISVGLAHALVHDGLEHCRARLMRRKPD